MRMAMRMRRVAFDGIALVLAGPAVCDVLESLPDVLMAVAPEGETG